MWDEDDEYFDREPKPASPVVKGAFVALGVVMIGLAIYWSVR